MCLFRIKTKSSEARKSVWGERVLRVSLFSLGITMISISLPEYSFAFESAKFAIKEICGHMMGNLGALLMTAAGVGAVVSAAFGNFKASYGLIITGVGAFTISSLLGLFFKDAGDLCSEANGGGGGGNAPARIRTVEADGTAAEQRSGLDPVSRATLAVAAGGQADMSSSAELPQGDTEAAQGEGFDNAVAEIADTF
jgi:MFS family permease